MQWPSDVPRNGQKNVQASLPRRSCNSALTPFETKRTGVESPSIAPSRLPGLVRHRHSCSHAQNIPHFQNSLRQHHHGKYTITICCSHAFKKNRIERLWMTSPTARVRFIDRYADVTIRLVTSDPSGHIDSMQGRETTERSLDDGRFIRA